jgi:hypothetical protein
MNKELVVCAILARIHHWWSRVSAVTKQFDQALREARRAEAAHRDALQNVSDAKALRLIDLQERLIKALPENSDILNLVDLRFEPGEEPRLFVDLVTSVSIEPDAHTFRLSQDRDYRRETLLETGHVDDMCRHILKYVAHRLIARERRGAAMTAPDTTWDWPTLVLGWLAAAAAGAMIFATIAKYLGKLNF